MTENKTEQTEKIICGEAMIEKKQTELEKELEREKLEREINEAYSLMAGIKFLIDKYQNQLIDDRDEIGFEEEIDLQTLISEIYEQIEQKLPKKFLIAEKLELDDKEQKILEELRK